MRAESWITCVLICLACMLLSLGPSQAATHNYVEDFTSKQYCDTVNTSAHWDTTAGELKLHSFELTLAGSYDTPGIARIGVTVSGDYAYVADGEPGLLVLAISDPTSPALVGSCNTPGRAWDVAVSGDYAYVADWVSGLQVIDITDPTSPSLAGSCDTPGTAWDVAISGNYAYVADGSSGLQVIDITDPTNPTPAGSCDTDDAWGVAISGDYAYVADHEGGLKVINITQPTNPTPGGSYGTADNALGVAISGDHAYIAAAYSGLQVIDISNPAQPTLAGSCDTPDWARFVAVSGDYAYVADELSGLQVIDITDPTSPTPAGSCDTPGHARGVAIAGDYAYVGDFTSGLQVIRIAEPVLPPLFAGGYGTPFYTRDVAISGDYAYVAVAQVPYGLQVINISDPTSPTYAGRYDTPSETHGIAVSGDYAYLADYASGLQVIDISNPANPTHEGSCPMSGLAHDVAISGDYAYVAAVNPDLQVIDISNPASPTCVASFHTAGDAKGLAVSGDCAYLAGYGSGLQVVDISNPTGPVYAGGCDTPGLAVRVAIDGDYAYVADYDCGLQVVDITNPESPTLAGACDTPGGAYGVAISGNYACVGDCYGGLQVIDITNPESPIPAGSYDTPDCATGVAISGDYVYLADREIGLQVIQVFQRVLNLADNMGQSVRINPYDEDALAARLMTAQTDSIRWELSADGGANWQEMVPGDTFLEFDYPGSELLWRSTHVYTGKGVNPTCTTLEIEWVYALVACVDIDPDALNPRSAGRWITAYVELPEGYDPADIDVSTVLLNETVPAEAEPTSVGDHDEDGIPDRTVKFSRPAVIDILPNGEHVEVCVSGQVAEHSFEGCDTIRVLMPKVTYPNGGEILEVREQCVITWELPAGYEADWSSVYYTAGDAESWNLIDDRVEGTSCTWIVPDVSSDRCLVLVEAYDAQGVMGYDMSDQRFTVSAGAGIPSEEAIPTRFALHPANPNPFTGGTVVSFDLPDSRRVKLTIHDVRGRLVQELIDEVRPAKSYSVQWDGKDSFGAEVPAGIYFVRLVAGDYEATGKIVLVR